MDTTHIYYFLAATTGLLIGLLVAEFYYKKSVHHARHVAPATIINNSHHIVTQKIYYYGALGFFVFSEHFLNVHIPEACYYLVVFAIAGGDIQKLATRFFRLK